jgi:hypothetical protein
MARAWEPLHTGGEQLADAVAHHRLAADVHGLGQGIRVRHLQDGGWGHVSTKVLEWS